MTVKGFHLVFGEDPPPLGTFSIPQWAEDDAMMEIMAFDKANDKTGKVAA
jgi:hypothetical protein